MAIAQGVRGLEVWHQINGFKLNDLTVDAQAKVNEITGLWSRPEFGDSRFPNTGRKGEHVLPDATTGKTVVYEGVLRAKTLDAWRALRRSLSGACNTTGTVLMTIDGTPQWGALGRVIDCPIDENPALDLNNVWPFQGEFSVSFRVDDGRYLALPKNTLTGLASAFLANAPNAGNGDAEPDFAVTGVGATLVLANETLGTQLAFAGMPTAGPGSFVLAWRTRQAFIDGLDALPYLNPATSNWWDEFVEGLQPGDNHIRVTGGTWAIGWYDTDI